MRSIAVCALVATAAAAALPGAARDAHAAEGAAERLAASIRFETVSPQDPADFDPEPFLAFPGFLEKTFPRLHRALELEIVADYSLLYTWRGTDPSLAPYLLTAHFDVVPIIPGTEAQWTQPAFGGVIADGFVWGRGALDDKVGVMAMLEAVEALVAENFRPTRTVYLAFGHDEELGGFAGAAGMTALLAERGVQLWFSLDEGMAILTDTAGITQPIAMIGTAEKGSMTLDLTARAPGGHSSIPPKQSAIGRIARAVLRVEDNPMPVHLDGVTGDMLDAIAPFLPMSQRIAIGQRWILGGLLARGLSSSPETNAMIRTTTAVTIVRGGVKTNVLPTSATATVNFRLHPNDSVEDITQRVFEIIDDPEIEVVLRSEPSTASVVSSSRSEAFSVLKESILALNPDVAVAPALVLGGTDSKHYGKIADDAYRFTPVRLGRDDARRLHGIDERISVANYETIPNFYAVLIRRASGS